MSSILPGSTSFRGHLKNSGKRMIRHTVVFRLKHAKGSVAEKKFLADADVLATIPGVKNFEKLRQVSRKNSYAFGFSMEFDNQAAYQARKNGKRRWVGCIGRVYNGSCAPGTGPGFCGATLHAKRS